MKIEIVQSLQQQQILAPQMILSMEVLLLTSQQLEARIEKEFAENPALEIEEHLGGPESGTAVGAPPEGETKLFEQLATFKEPSGLNWLDAPRRRSRGGDFDKHEALQNVEGAPPGLRDYLIQQLHLLDIAPRFVHAGEFIVNNIDERGYLLHPVEALRECLRDELTDEEFELVLTTVRNLDPPGVGAEGLQECLLLQLDRDLQTYPLESEILRNHIDDLRNNKIPKIARDLGRTVQDIKEALEIISLLEPYPGREYSPAVRAVVRPDVVVEEVEDGYVVHIHDDSVPPLKVSDTCRNLLSESRGKREITQFLRRKIDSAQWLIQAVEQRRRTLRDITTAIVDYQRAFLDHGPEQLRAMKMQTIADIVGVHISTISRAIKGKYVQTPRGMFELRYFFTGGVERGDGEVESRRNVYRRISNLIENEDKSKPLSDTAIARELRADGLDIARRTVTKYRDQRGIPPSRLRRKY